eukprot:scaffold13379_cov127-Skeletonema_dohrnii-CCMP3373.AAC.2
MSRLTQAHASTYQPANAQRTTNTKLEKNKSTNLYCTNHPLTPPLLLSGCNYLYPSVSESLCANDYAVIAAG